jgi:2-hydroxy-3-oxopropionate reductase
MLENKLIGFIGVGVMGRPMARRLIEQGHSLVIYDKDANALAELQKIGAHVADSVREVADSAGVVFTSLPTPAVFRDVAIDLSTVGSTTEKEVATALLAKGIETIDAPVSGGAAGAQKGTLAVMIAGKPEVVAKVRELFDVFGKTFSVGSEPGQGQLMKLLNNMLSSTAFAITSEAFVAGVKGGLDPETMMAVINAGSGKNGATQDKFPKQVLPRTFDFGFPISSVCKDIGLAVDECQALGVPMWVGSTVRQLWNFAALQDGTKRDMTELVRYIEDWSNHAGANANTNAKQ